MESSISNCYNQVVVFSDSVHLITTKESSSGRERAARQNVEYDVRRDADHFGGQCVAEQPVQRRGCQLRTADGVDVGRTGQANGEFARGPGAFGRSRERARQFAATNQCQSSSGEL